MSKVGETNIDTSSLSKERLSFNHELTFTSELIDASPFLDYAENLANPLYIEYSIPIMVQARWHKKSRINKKWLKRYGMKKDTVLVRSDVESINSNVDNETTPYNCLTKSVEYGMVLNNMQYKFRPDQLRKNLKTEWL